MFQDNSRLRRLILIGTPLFTGILLLFHPIPDPIEMGLTQPLDGREAYLLIAPFADRFLALHALFAPALALLGLSIVLLLQGVDSMAANISRLSAFVFVIVYTMYETIAGTAIGLLIRGAVGLTSQEQAVIGEAGIRLIEDPVFGDGLTVVMSIGSIAWLLAVTMAASALRRAGKPLLPCILLGLSFIFALHAPPIGPVGMLLFLLAVVGLEQTGLLVIGGEQETAPIS